MSHVIPARGRPPGRRRNVWIALLIIVLVAALVIAAAWVLRDRGESGGAGAAPPGPPITASPRSSSAQAPPDRYGSARAELAALPVKDWDRTRDFQRYRFGKAWSDEVDVEFGRNGCNTRNDILRRDLDDVTVRPGTCLVETGVLHDPYTGAVIPFQRGPETSPGVQIDHVVSLADAWYKGARTWDDQRRLEFANDPRNLLAVSPKANFDKAFRDAAGWLPPNAAFRCDFVTRQIEVKTAYGLWVSEKEKAALSDVLEHC